MDRNLVLLAAFLAGMSSPRLQASEGCAAASRMATVPLVELYTSEGCSSCPPADRWLSRRFDDGQANFLAFHVDYWDSIGWPDRFASPAYSQRQRERVQGAGSRAVFTPQVMLGSKVQVNWRQDAAYAAALRQASKPAAAALSLRLTPVDGGWRVSVGAAARTDSARAGQVWLARYVDGQSTQVSAGENRDALLRHDRVVRELQGPWPLDGLTVSRTIALPAQPGAWGITAFVQNPDGEVLQSLDLRADTCRK